MMANITPELNICLQRKGAQPVLHREFDTSRIESFLQEAYSIVRPSECTIHDTLEQADPLIKGLPYADHDEILSLFILNSKGFTAGYTS